VTTARARRLRALGRALRWPVARLARARLRTKLALSLSIAALLPMLGVASLASGVVLGSLERGLTDDVERQLDVALNLSLRTVERLGDDTAQLAADVELAAAVSRGEAAVADVLARAAPHLPSALIQVLAPDGSAVASTVVGGDLLRFGDLAVDARSPLVLAAAGWSRRVTLELAATGAVVVRAAAPVIDDELDLVGLVVLSVPVDGDFADAIKGALGADVLVGGLAGGIATSTVRDRFGRRLDTVPVPVAVLVAVRARQRPVTTLPIAGSEHAVAWAALEDDRGHALGLFAVAIDRQALSRAQSVAFRSLAIGAALALLFAIVLAGWLARRVGQPIAKLHRGAVAVARGDLEHRIDVAEGDEIGDLALAFSHMTTTLKENQQRLAARMREMVAIHDAGRVMSSVIDLGQVSSKIVDSVARVFDVRLCALFLIAPGGRPDEPRLLVAAARVRRDLGSSLAGGSDDAVAHAGQLAPIAGQVARLRATLRVDDATADPRRRDAAVAAGVDGSLMATPLERKGAVVGVLIVGRARTSRAFLEADANLLATFADQAAAAIENARLYEQVRDASEELEAKVRLRTAELTAINAELGRALADLRETQAQLVLSERMAGLGLLVAGVAHEINSPSAAIRGAVDAMTSSIGALAGPLRRVTEAVEDPGAREALFVGLDRLGRELGARRLPTGAAVRRAARELRAKLEPVVGDAAADLARRLSECGADEANVDELVAQVPAGGIPAVLIYLCEQANLHRNAFIIDNAISRIQRIVGALKTYSHLDEEPTRVGADLHEGIETTLTLFAYALRDITVVRRFGQLPPVPIFVDELNQVWTNLIQNAVQALEGKGTIAIETEVAARPRDGAAGVAVRVIDDGPGIEPEVQARIFEPFFTTKAKGEGTGLGLGIVAQIVAKHGGEVRCESAPGRTAFEVWLPGGVAGGGGGAS